MRVLVRDHPCYSGAAHHHYARIHLAVAEGSGDAGRARPWHSSRPHSPWRWMIWSIPECWTDESVKA